MSLDSQFAHKTRALCMSLITVLGERTHNNGPLTCHASAHVSWYHWDELSVLKALACSPLLDGAPTQIVRLLQV